MQLLKYEKKSKFIDNVKKKVNCKTFKRGIDCCLWQTANVRKLPILSEGIKLCKVIKQADQLKCILLHFIKFLKFI